MAASLSAVPFSRDYRNNQQKIVFQKSYKNPHVRKDIGKFVDKGFFDEDLCRETGVKGFLKVKVLGVGPSSSINSTCSSACVRAHGGRAHYHTICLDIEEEDGDNEYVPPVIVDPEPTDPVKQVPDSSSTYALLGFALSALLIFRRRKGK